MTAPSASASAKPVEGPSPPSSGADARTLGKYELVRSLARGGMGEVHLAKLPGELGFEKQLVVKTIHAELAEDPRFVELFAAEARTAVALSHPNIAPIYELGRAEDGSLYTAMGWVDGPNLDQLRRALASGRLELGAALYVTRELLDGLAYAHSDEHGRPPLVHRDITPRNVLVDRSGRVQIVDFGIAKPAQTQAGGSGSVGYMAPEQARGGAVDPRADVFAVGCVLYELLTGERAFPGEGVWSPPDLEELPASASVAPLLRRALALEPDGRFADAGEFLRALGPVLAEHAPAFGTQDLAAILRELGDRWGAGSGDGGAPGATPVTQATRRTQAFASRPLARATSPGTEPDLELSEDAEDRGGGAAVPTADEARDEAAGASATPAISETPSPRGAPGRPALRSALISALLGGLTVALIAYAFVAADGEPRDGDREASSARPEDAKAGPAPEPSSAAGPEDGEAPDPLADSPTPKILSVELEPADAELSLDGEALDGPPYRVELDPQADAAATLEAQHPEYRPRSVELDPATATGDPLILKLEPRESGQLTVLAPTVAWAEVWLDGEKLGTTPLTDAPVLEGRHKLEVRCTAAVCEAPRKLLSKSVTIQPKRDKRIVAE